MSEEAHIRGSWGHLIVLNRAGDELDGVVLVYDHEGNLPDPDGEAGYADVARVDLAEWRRT